MSSDKNIIVRETSGATAQVAIVSVDKPKDFVRRQINADSVLMNPTKRILALKCRSFLFAVPLQLSNVACSFQPERTCRSSTSTTSGS
jgi:hypothetical protein